MRRFTAILQTNREPGDLNALWYQKGILKYYEAGEWRPFNVVHPKDINIKIDAIPNVKTLKEALDYLFEKSNNYKIVDNFEELNNLKKDEINYGTHCYVNDENKCYIYSKELNKWIEENNYNNVSPFYLLTDKTIITDFNATTGLINLKESDYAEAVMYIAFGNGTSVKDLTLCRLERVEESWYLRDASGVLPSVGQYVYIVATDRATIYIPVIERDIDKEENYIIQTSIKYYRNSIESIFKEPIDIIEAITTNTDNINSLFTWKEDIDQQQALQDAKILRNEEYAQELNTKIDAKVIEAGGVAFDLEPTQDSTNAVFSGGVYKYITDLAITTDKIEDAAVTTEKLSTDIQALIANISKTATFAGIATPTTNPGTPDGPVFYFAVTEGIYPNFSTSSGSLSVNKGELAIFYNPNGIWTKQLLTKTSSGTDLVNRGIFMPDSDTIDLKPGVLIDFGVKTIPEGYNKELYMSYINNTSYPTIQNLIQIIDEDGKVVAQKYYSEKLSGITEVNIPANENSGISFGAIINNDIDNSKNFNTSLHINKERKFVGFIPNVVKQIVDELSSTDLDQYNYILYNIRKYDGEGTAGLDIKKQPIYKDKIISIWGKCSVPLSIIHARNTTDTLLQLSKQDDTSETGLVAQLYLRSPSSGIKTTKFTNLPTAPEGTELYATVNWDNISSDIANDTDGKIDILFLPENEIKNSVDNSIQQISANKENIDGLKENIFEPTSWADDADFSKINNAILDVWNNNVKKDDSTIYLRIVRASNPLIQFISVKGGDYTKAIAQYYPEQSDVVKTGTETISVKFLAGKGHDGESFNVLINWDALPTTSSIYLDIDFPLNRLRNSMNKDAYAKLGQLEKKLAAISFPDWFSDEVNNQLSINVFGDVISKQFKDKWFAFNKDLEIVLLGDSIVGLQSASGAIPENEAIALPPGCQYYHWTWGLYTRLVKNKPLYNRADSSVFTKTGDFESITSSSGNKLDMPSMFGEWSVAANTYQSNAANASVKFDWNLDEYEKLNIIHSLNPDGASCAIQIGDGTSTYNGMVLVSLDKSEWVEANNFALSQNSNPDNLSETDCEQQGHALHQRHRRIWMKRVVETGTITVTFKKTEVDTEKYMYFWGTERWNGYTTIITNLGRGGRTTSLLNRNISDVIDRNPDLVIHSLSLANEHNVALDTLKRDYKRFFFGGEDGAPDWVKQRSMLTKSENYSKFSYLVFMPHGRGVDFVGDTVAPATIDKTPQYFRYKIMTKFIKDNMANYENVSVIELFDQILHEGKRMGMTFEQTLAGTDKYAGSLTSDGIHLNRLGSAIYTKYLSALFDLM